MLARPESIKKLEALYARAGMPCELDACPAGGVIIYAATKEITERIARHIVDIARMKDPKAFIVDGVAREDKDFNEACRWWIGIRWDWCRFAPN